MATFRHISTKLVLVLDAETAGGKKMKRVTVSNIREGVSADALRELAAALGQVLAHPVAQVLLYTEEALEREDEEGSAPETGGISNEAASEAGEDAARTGGRREADKAALTGGGDSQRKLQVRGGSISAFAPRGTLSGEDAVARILPRDNKGQTSNISLGYGSMRPASAPCRRREPPFWRRGDPVQNQAAMYGMASPRIGALMKRSPPCFFRNSGSVCRAASILKKQIKTGVILC